MTEASFSQPIAATLNLKPAQVQTVLDLFEGGATIPFIARYRKDKTGNLDEVQIQAIQDQLKLVKEFTERKTFILKSITDSGNLTEAVQQKLDKATTVTELEDIYLPYKPKRKTRAQAAREAGLEPLSQLLLQQQSADPTAEAARHLNETIKDTEAALQGARDIIAETINEDAVVRASVRKLFEQTATFQCKLVEDKREAAAKYKDYFDFSELIHKIPSHRILAILRGFVEGCLRMSIEAPEEDALFRIEKLYVTASPNPCVEQIKRAAKDAYRRLLQPSLESEFRMLLKAKADEEAINVFAENLRQLLLSSPLGSKRILAIDPGYRTGCKLGQRCCCPS